jgi:acyl-coenzyme A thioesterase PaaI-like protein
MPLPRLQNSSSFLAKSHLSKRSISLFNISTRINRCQYSRHGRYAAEDSCKHGDWGVRLSARCCRFSTSMRNRNQETSDFLSHFIRANKPPQSTVNYFSSLGWTRKTLEDEMYEMIPFYSRYGIEHTGENRFFSRTVQTDTTVPHILALQLKDLETPDPGISPFINETAPKELANGAPAEVICLMALGEDLQAHPSIVHGGFQAVVFDEVMRLLILLHQNNICIPGPRDIHFTATLTISYSAPVIAPSNVLVRSRLIRREGRKWFTKGEIVNSAGKILTSAESLWVTAKPFVRH